MPVNREKLDEFMGKAVNDLGAAISAAMVVMGEKLGLYKAMAGAGPLSPAEIASRTKVPERYIREWLCNQAAGGYVSYDPSTDRFMLDDEQAFALADENSPASLLGAFHIVMSAIKDESKLTKAIKAGRGLDWGEHDQCLYTGTERFFRTSYEANLVSSWIPALEGVEEKLKKGAVVADVGCGHGASTIIMAKAFPNSNFVGFDYHKPSILTANKRAKQAGVGDRVKFKVAKSTDFPGNAYDLVAIFDALHDMGDPHGTASHVRKSLKSDGTFMVVEPFANDKIEHNLNPIGRMFYAASTMICVPASLAHNGPALGAQAGESKLREVITSGGFTRFRLATKTPFNLVLEAKP
jgi:2-polyprenyl-3-methyl-5-hydroxy-6-metoxy-1,4-benzoquinol methylase